MPGWWTAHPAVWDRELDALTAAGWTWRIEETAADRGVILVVVDYPLPAEHSGVARPGTAAAADTAADRVVPLVVRYPPTYPWFPPEVADPQHRLDLPRHRQPVTGALCLTTSRDWVIGTTAAELLRDQMPRMLAAATADGPLPAGVEVPAAEPVGTTVLHHAGARVLIDSTLRIPREHRSGTLLVGFTRMSDGSLGAGALTLIRAGDEQLRPFPARLTDQFQVTVCGRWTRWDGYRPTLSPAAAWRLAAQDLDPVRYVDPAGAALPVEPDGEVLGLLVPSETGYRRSGEEWLFVLRHHTAPPVEPTADPAPDPAKGVSPGPQRRQTFELYLSAPAGPTDVAARSPGTAALRESRVLVVGVGAIGGSVATGLARAGIGRLDLVDRDTVDPATACRQAAPVCFAGFSKASAMQVLLAENNPHVQVLAHTLTIGAVQVAEDGQPDPHAGIVHLIRHADLVIDTAADPAVSRYLAAICAAGRRPFLHASATAGAHGGVVALIAAAGTGCWWCLLHRRHDQTLPVPPAADQDAGTVVPAGCTAPTFTGTGADLDTIASHATRTAIAHLTGDQPPRSSVLYVASLRDARGRPVPVSWRTRPLRRHRGCPMPHRPADDSRTKPGHGRRAAIAPGDPTRDRDPRRGSDPAERDGPQLENSTEETNTTHAGAAGRGRCSTRNRPDRR